MQPGEIYLAQNARFSGEFAAGFTGLTPPFVPNPSGAVLIRDVMVNAAFFIIWSVFL
uniref:hypothetical protein n=1 Tax=Escherichia coli TaxID=562 RepID=UPI00156854FA|nr:hypothetical protein [Escherichia coli]